MNSLLSNTAKTNLHYYTDQHKFYTVQAVSSSASVPTLSSRTNSSPLLSIFSLLDSDEDYEQRLLAPILSPDHSTNPTPVASPVRNNLPSISSLFGVRSNDDFLQVGPFSPVHSNTVVEVPSPTQTTTTTTTTSSLPSSDPFSSHFDFYESFGEEEEEGEDEMEGGREEGVLLGKKREREDTLVEPTEEDMKDISKWNWKHPRGQRLTPTLNKTTVYFVCDVKGCRAAYREETVKTEKVMYLPFLSFLPFHLSTTLGQSNNSAKNGGDCFYYNICLSFCLFFYYFKRRKRKK
eukprot:TRINITY_DN16897_c0_g1_i1.p1 TRINITY_DN16897_c0_g1~~TRINITY_DN16897_c0_g1_i1.p1  ORF type:complete len:292 (-),score=76.81 TRINITY_DN16897_c0_g1_i1:53-928(-)